MNVARYLLVLVVSAALSRSIGTLEIGGAVFDLMLIVAIYPTMMHGFREGYIFAWLAGFAVDVQSVGTVVPACLSFLAVAYAVSVVRGLLELRGNAATQAVTVAAAALAVGNVNAIALRLTSGSHATPLLAQAAATALYAGLVAPMLFALLDALPLTHRRVTGGGLPLVAAGASRPARQPAPAAAGSAP